MCTTAFQNLWVNFEITLRLCTKKPKLLQLSTLELENMEKIHLFQSIELKSFDKNLLCALMIHSINEKYTNKNTVTYRNTINSNSIDDFQQFFIDKHLFNVCIRNFVDWFNY